MEFIKKVGIKKSAFTIIEIVIVLVIFALIAFFIPTSVKKIERNKTKLNTSNRYDCYWKGNTLYQKYGNQKNEEAAVDTIKINGVEKKVCKISIPSNVLYIEMLAIGGGGAGGDFSGEFPPDENFYSYLELKYNDLNTLPDYLRDIFNSANKNSLETASGEKLWIGVFLKRQKLLYSVSGEPGELVSYFLSKTDKDRTYYIAPGKGGTVKNCPPVYNENSSCETTDGEPTYVFKKIQTGNSITYSLVAKAKGGTTGKIVGQEYNKSQTNLVNRKNYRISNVLFGKKLDDIVLEKSSSILARSSDFLTQSKSKIDYGKSGSGAYSYSTDTSGYFTIIKNNQICKSKKADGSCALDGYEANGITDLTPYVSNVFFKKLDDNCELKDSSSDFSIYKLATTNYSGKHSPDKAYPFEGESIVTTSARYICTMPSYTGTHKCLDGSNPVKINGVKAYKCNPTSGIDGAFSILW